MNINVAGFIAGEQRGRRVISNPLKGAVDRIETFDQVMAIAELHVTLHVVAPEDMEPQ